MLLKEGSDSNIQLLQKRMPQRPGEVTELVVIIESRETCKYISLNFFGRGRLSIRTCGNVPVRVKKVWFQILLEETHKCS
jgi:hypothetical protein